MNAIEPGRVVVSRAGRDKGKPMVVLSVEGEYAFVADGRLRTVEKPKKKKFMHLLPQKELLGNILESINNGRCILDAEIRKALRTYEDARRGEHACRKKT